MAARSCFSRKVLMPNHFGMTRNCGVSGMIRTARPRWWLPSRSRRSTSAGVRTLSKKGAPSCLTMSGQDSLYTPIPPTSRCRRHARPRGMVRKFNSCCVGFFASAVYPSGSPRASPSRCRWIAPLLGEAAAGLERSKNDELVRLAARRARHVGTDPWQLLL